MNKHRTFVIICILLALLLTPEASVTPIWAAPATFTDSGSTLMIDLGAGEQLTIVSNGTTYSFQTNQTFADGGVTAPGSDFSTFGGSSITLTASGLARYSTIDITDSGAGASVTFADSSGNAYSDSFDITLDDGSTAATVDGAVTLTSGSLTITADAINVNADVSTAGAQTYNSPILLTADSVLSSTGNGDVTFNSTIDGFFSLTVNTAGVTLFENNIGSTTRIGDLTTDAAGSTTLRTLTLRTSGTMTFNDPVTGSGGLIIDSNQGGGDTTFASTIDGGDWIIAEPSNLTFGGAVGGTTAPTGLQFTSPSSTVAINGGLIRTSNLQRLRGNLTFDSPTNTTTLESTGGGEIRLGQSSANTIRSATDGEESVIVNTTGTTQINGVLGDNNQRLNALTTNAGGTTQLNGGSLTLAGNTLTFNDAVTLSADTVISDTGAVAFNSTVDGAFALTIDAGGNMTVGGAMGGSTPLASLDVTSGGEISANADITTANGDIGLGADAMTLTGAMNAGTGIVTLRPATASQLIDLGGADTAGTLGLTDAELDLITTSLLRIGSSDAGSISFTDRIDPAGTDTLSLITGDTIVDAYSGGGQRDVQVSNLALQAANGIADSGATIILDTDVDTIAALNTTSGGISIVEIGFATSVSGGDLIIGTVDGVVGVQNTASTGAAPNLGVQVETNNGDLTVNSDVFNNRKDIFLVAQHNNNGDHLFTNAANISVGANNAQIEVRANNMDLSGGTITAGASAAAILRNDRGSQNIAITLGGADGAATLGLTDAELDTITAGTLQIGHTSAGSIDITAPIDLTDGPNIPTVNFISGAAIDGSDGNTLTANTLHVTAGTGIGTNGDPFAFNATELTTSGSGNQYLSEGDNVTIGDTGLDAGNGNSLQLTGGTFFTTSSGGDIQENATVQDGATLAGTGTVSGTLTTQSGGTIAPGTSPGQINTGSVTFAAGSNFNVEVNGPASAGTDYDQLNVSGGVAIDPAATLVTSGTITGTAGAEIIIINNDGADVVSGTFAGLSDGAAVSINGQNFRIFYAAGDGNDVTLEESTVPTLTAFTRQDPAVSPTNADSLVFRATFSEPVQNVDAADFAVNSTTTATVTAVSQVSTSIYHITVSGGDLSTFNGAVGLDLSGAQDIQDAVGNPLPAGEPATDEVYTMDNTAPSLTAITRQDPAVSPTNADSLVFRATFSEPVQNVDAADFTVNSTSTATVTAVSQVSTSIYDITVSGGDLPTFNGAVGLDLSGAQDIQDAVGNPLPAGEPATDEVYTVENTVPALTAITRQDPAASPTNADSLVFRATFSEPVQNVDAADFTVNSTSTATVTAVSQVSTSIYHITVSGGDLPTFNGAVGLDLSGAQDIQDAVGNPLPAGEPATDEVYTVGNSGFAVTVNQATTQADPTNAAPITFIAVFDQAPANFTAADVTLGGTASGVLSTTLSGGPTVYTVTVTGMAGTGTVTAAIEAGAVTDLAGNGNTASTSTDNEVTFDPIAPQADNLNAVDVITSGGTAYTFTVAYRDNLAIDASTIDGNDIRVTGAGGFDQLATLLSVTPAANGSPRDATYQLTAAGGSWNTADNGTYTVALQDSQVGDTAGNFATGKTLGTFDVAITHISNIFLPLIK